MPPPFNAASRPLPDRPRAMSDGIFDFCLAAGEQDFFFLEIFFEKRKTYSIIERDAKPVRKFFYFQEVLD